MKFRPRTLAASKRSTRDAPSGAKYFATTSAVRLSRSDAEHHLRRVVLSRHDARHAVARTERFDAAFGECEPGLLELFEDDLAGAAGLPRGVRAGDHERAGRHVAVAVGDRHLVSVRHAV